MSNTHLHQQLEKSSGMKLKLKINDNRSTMLSVRWEPDCTRVSLHRIFLMAPKNVMDSLACYLRREDESIAPKVRSFIEDNLKKLDYTHQLEQMKLYTQGHVYNLQEIYNQVNAEYFEDRLKLSITWFGKPVHRSRSRVTFGLYHDPLKLVKIHRLLDNPSFPDYVVSFVVFHEMLHYACPSYIDEKGIHRVHSKEFKHQEKQFHFYNLAQRWIRDHRGRFF
jgi:hypothetical protein